jgi:adenylate cyclase class 2
MIETEIKIRFGGTPQAAQELIEGHNYALVEPRTLEQDQVFDRGTDELRAADQLLRLRRSGSRATITYKGPATRESYKSREEIEFDVSDPAAFELVIARLGYKPRFRYEKYRTKFGAHAGIITIDETPIGVFLELEGPGDWIDRTAADLGFSKSEYCTASYSALYRKYQSTHPDAPPHMVFGTGGWRELSGKST